MSFKAPKRVTTIKPGSPTKSFYGQVQVDGGNLLNMPLGTLFYNENMEYLYSKTGNEVYLSTKRGSSLVKDITSIVYGAGNYVYNAADEYFVWVETDGKLQYLTTGNVITDLGKTFTTGYQHYYVMYGQGTLSTLYGCDPTTGTYKISGATPTYGGYVSSVPVDAIAFSYISGRMFGIKGHTVYWTEVQSVDSNLTNIENWASNNKNLTSPDDGTGFKFLIDNGEVMFFLKDTGIWYLPNANESTSNWEWPKTDSDTGTKSPKTVCLARYGKKGTGFIFLGSDKTLRFCQPSLERNAGSLPTLRNHDAKIISAPFQNILDKIPDAYLSKCTAVFYKGLYILNIVSEAGTELDYTIVVDTEKLMPAQGSESYPQPFWFFSQTMNYSEMLVRKITPALYGFNVEGYISQLFVDNTFVEEVPNRINSDGEVAIPWAWYLAWHKYFDREVELVECLLNFKVRGYWQFTFSVNSFSMGEGAIPDFDSGDTVQISPKLTGYGLYDISRYDVDRYSSTGQLSQNVGVNRFGEYFLFGAYNNNTNEPATFYSLFPFFKAIKSSPVSTYS